MLAGLMPREFWIKNARINPDGVIPDHMMADDAEGFLLLAILLHPESRGSVRLRSNNPLDKPLIEAGYFTDERDLETLASGAMMAQRVAQAMGFDVLCLPPISGETIGTMGYWKATCRDSASTLYHPTSTCAMGLVLDSRLRVKGVNRLRVADASAFPHITSGNTNAPAIMMGEMACDIIREEYGLSGAP
jgi:choline dehydrogenase